MSDMHVCGTCGGVEDCRDGCTCAGCIGAARDKEKADPVSSILAVECPECGVKDTACLLRHPGKVCISRIRAALTRKP